MFKAKEIPNFIQVSDVFHLVAHHCDSRDTSDKTSEREEGGWQAWLNTGSGGIQNVISRYCPLNMK